MENACSAGRGEPESAIASAIGPQLTTMELARRSIAAGLAPTHPPAAQRPQAALPTPPASSTSQPQLQARSLSIASAALATLAAAAAVALPPPSAHASVPLQAPDEEARRAWALRQLGGGLLRTVDAVQNAFCMPSKQNERRRFRPNRGLPASHPFCCTQAATRRPGLLPRPQQRSSQSPPVSASSGCNRSWQRGERPRQKATMGQRWSAIRAWCSSFPTLVRRHKGGRAEMCSAEPTSVSIRFCMTSSERLLPPLTCSHD